MAAVEHLLQIPCLQCLTDLGAADLVHTVSLRLALLLMTPGAWCLRLECLPAHFCPPALCTIILPGCVQYKADQGRCTQECDKLLPCGHTCSAECGLCARRTAATAEDGAAGTRMYVSCACVDS